MTEREELAKALRNYISAYGNYTSDSDTERLFSGVLAFIWVNLYDYPFQPTFGMTEEEVKPRKWWMFWRRK